MFLQASRPGRALSHSASDGTLPYSSNTRVREAGCGCYSMEYSSQVQFCAVCTDRRRRLLSAGFAALQGRVCAAQEYRAAVALRDEAFRAWRARAHAKSLHCSLVTIRGKLHRQVRLTGVLMGPCQGSRLRRSSPCSGVWCFDGGNIN